MRLLASCLVVLGVLPQAAAAQERQARQNPLIVEVEGRVGSLRLGARIGSYQGQLEKEEGSSDIYWSRDRAIRVTADSSGKVGEIEVSGRSFFTQRFVWPQRSTLEDVLSKYGRPRRLCTKRGRINAPYEGLEFTVGYEAARGVRQTDSAEMLESTVESITLHEARDYEESYREGMIAHDRQDWQESARLMERAICDAPPRGETAKRVRLYGMWYEPYLPRYHLGLAWFKLGECGAALASWRDSEDLEEVQQDEIRVRQIEEGREHCRRTVAETPRL